MGASPPRPLRWSSGLAASRNELAGVRYAAQPCEHTRFAARDLRHLTARAVGQLGDRFHALDHRISDRVAHDVVNGTNPNAGVARSQALRGLFDGLVGLC